MGPQWLFTSAKGHLRTFNKLAPMSEKNRKPTLTTIAPTISRSRTVQQIVLPVWSPKRKLKLGRNTTNRKALLPISVAEALSFAHEFGIYLSIVLATFNALP